METSETSMDARWGAWTRTLNKWVATSCPNPEAESIATSLNYTLAEEERDDEGNVTSVTMFYEACHEPFVRFVAGEPKCAGCGADVDWAVIKAVRQPPEGQRVHEAYEAEDLSSGDPICADCWSKVVEKAWGIEEAAA